MEVGLTGHLMSHVLQFVAEEQRLELEPVLTQLLSMEGLSVVLIAQRVLIVTLMLVQVNINNIYSSSLYLLLYHFDIAYILVHLTIVAGPREVFL